MGFTVNFGEFTIISFPFKNKTKQNKQTNKNRRKVSLCPPAPLSGRAAGTDRGAVPPARRSGPGRAGPLEALRCCRRALRGVLSVRSGRRGGFGRLPRASGVLRCQLLMPSAIRGHYATLHSALRARRERQGRGESGTNSGERQI